MATRHYVERFSTWQNPSVLTDNQWLEFDLSAFNIPGNSVVEIAISNLNASAERIGGVRATSGSLERKIQIVKSLDGDSFVTMHVQSDAAGKIDYFAEFASDINFTVVGYWLGCNYVEQFQIFSPLSSGVWEGRSLSSSGVSPGQITEFAISNTNLTLPRDVGVRASGSSLSRLFNVSDAAGAGNNCLSQLALASGTNAAIEVYAENSNDCNVFFLGHFSTPPGEYVETDISFAEPATQGQWLALDVGASGIPNKAVCEFVLGQDYTLSQQIGVRQTSSSLVRLFDLEESQDNLGLSWAKMHVVVDDSGFVQHYAQDTTPPDPMYIVKSYWTNFTNSINPFIISSSVDCFVQGLNPNIHYIEKNGLTGSTFFNVSSTGVWLTQSLDSFGVPASTTKSPIVAEIGITNSSTTVSYSGGVRSTSSSNERRFAMHDAEGNGQDALSLLVPVDSSGNISIYAGHISFLDFWVIGFWRGATYIDEYTTFSSSSADTWVNHNLGSAYQDKVVEIAITNTNIVQQSGGVRSAGSLLDRRHTISKAETGEDHVSLHVNASGSNGSIEINSSNIADTTFTLVGRWDFAPGDYIETFTDVGTVSSVNTWQAVDINVPLGDIAEIVSENRYNFSERNLGVRQVGSKEDTRRWTLRETDLASTDLAADMFRSFVTVTSGTHVELYSSSTTTAHIFRLVGYWDNLSIIPAQINNNVTLFVSATAPSSNTNISLFMHGAQIAPPLDCFIEGVATKNANASMFVFGVNVFKTDSTFSILYPSGVSLYTAGSGIVSESGQFSLNMSAKDIVSTSVDMYTDGLEIISNSNDLFLKVVEPSNAQITLYLLNLVDPGPGLIREQDAVFYLSRRNHTNTDTTELTKGINWDILSTIISNKPFLDTSGAVQTAGDGTFPIYNDMGGSFSSHATGFALLGSAPNQQNIVGHIINPSDYSYAGSGSITTAFWMSGAKTSGNIAEVGWFNRGNNFSLPGNALNDHTIGIKISSGNAIKVLTSVRDLPYDQQTTSSDLWWGGTTHYGTPTGSSWTWRAPSQYWAWDEEWPEIDIVHNDIAFFVVRSDFIPSGIVSGIPAHMDVWLSVDGNPWVFVGSGITGPPASSIFSASNPVNFRAEDAVGLKLQARNNLFGGSNETIMVNEIILWSDTTKFEIQELSSLHSIVPTYMRPLDEYRPTLVPNKTYITRTIKPLSGSIVIPGNQFRHAQIHEGFLITLEVGIGAYGEDSFGYLLEEKPPSGFIIRNIRPDREIRYPGQTSRPTSRQQIFNDPKSGIMEPYDHDFGVNAYGASIRWVNHDNHPQNDARRSPTPTGIYTYELFPVSYATLPPADNFSFDGSGLFFNGSTNKGIVSVPTTGTTSGSVSGPSQGLLVSDFSLYMSGPNAISGTIDLYIRTIEKFTSAYIGNSNRTPLATDFIFQADGTSNLKGLAGIEYGPSMYMAGPSFKDDGMSLYMRAPEAVNASLFTKGIDQFNTSGSFPSGLSLNVGDGHEQVSGLFNIFTSGPDQTLDDISMYTQAGGVGRTSLFEHGHISQVGIMSGVIKGPEFTTTSGNFTYPLDASLFTFPSGGQSPDMYSTGKDIASGIALLFIGQPPLSEQWTIFVKTENSSTNNNVKLFCHGFIASASGVNQTFNNTTLYLEAIGATFPYTAGGSNSWTLFAKAESGNLVNNANWPLFVRADTTTSGTSPLYTFAHASGESPHGILISGVTNLVCSTNPDDLSSIGAIPHNSDDDPWTLFLKGDPGHFGIMSVYMSGAVPILALASGNLFVEGLFEQEINNVNFYIMGVSGLFNNGPSGLHLFLNAEIVVYNRNANLYSHGY